MSKSVATGLYKEQVSTPPQFASGRCFDFNTCYEVMNGYNMVSYKLHGNVNIQGHKWAECLVAQLVTM